MHHSDFTLGLASVPILAVTSWEDKKTLMGNECQLLPEIVYWKLLRCDDRSGSNSEHSEWGAPRLRVFCGCNNEELSLWGVLIFYLHSTSSSVPFNDKKIGHIQLKLETRISFQTNPANNHWHCALKVHSCLLVLWVTFSDGNNSR